MFKEYLLLKILLLKNFILINKNVIMKNSYPKLVGRRYLC